MSPRKESQSPDKIRGKRLQEERKRIFKTQKEFTKYGKFSGTSVTRWEGEGLDIPASALTILAERGADIHYILTGVHTENIGVSNLLESDKRINELEERVAELKSQLKDKDEIISLQREKLESTSNNSELSKTLEQVVTVLEQRGIVADSDGSAG